jgi:hypothetical protein
VPVRQIADRPIVELRAHREAVDGVDHRAEGVERPQREPIGREPRLDERPVDVHADLLVEDPRVVVVLCFHLDDEVVYDVDPDRRLDGDDAGDFVDRDAVLVADEVVARRRVLEERREGERDIGHLDEVVVGEEEDAARGPVVLDEAERLVREVARDAAAQDVDVASGIAVPEDAFDRHDRGTERRLL